MAAKQTRKVVRGWGHIDPDTQTIDDAFDEITIYLKKRDAKKWGKNPTPCTITYQLTKKTIK